MYEQQAPKTLKEYIYEKRDILEELGIELTWKQWDHLRGLKTEAEVDRYMRDLMFTPEHKMKDRDYKSSSGLVYYKEGEGWVKSKNVIET